MTARAGIPRGLSEEEQAAWARLAHTVTPMAGRKAPVLPREKVEEATQVAAPPKPAKSASPVRRPVPSPAPQAANTLDSHWDRRLKKGEIAPDFTLDLHGHSLDAAYQRLMRGLAQAKAMQARLVLVVTGKPRPVDAADRGHARGAIRAKILDWLAASDHHADIAAIRGAHRRHGEAGALYIVLKRRR